LVLHQLDEHCIHDRDRDTQLEPESLAGYNSHTDGDVAIRHWYADAHADADKNPDADANKPTLRLEAEWSCCLGWNRWCAADRPQSRFHKPGGLDVHDDEAVGRRIYAGGLFHH